MIALEIFKLDSEDEPVSTLKTGEHIFGRGPLLQCDDRRVSRNHGIFTITNEVASITSIHQNPCFFQSANSKTITILPKDSAVNVNDGDKFSLLADQFWFRIKLKTNLQTENLPKHNEERIENQLVTSKRNYEEEPNNQNKKLKIHNNNVSDSYCEQASSSNSVKKEILSDSEPEDTSIQTELDGTIPVKKELKHENNAIVKNETLVHHDGGDEKTEFSSNYEFNELIKTEADDTIPVKKELKEENENNETENQIILQPDGEDAKEEPADDDDSKLNDINNINNTVTNGPDSAGTSGLNQRQWRDYCVYGLQCYRKSEAHLKEFSHPGDSDYESDSNDQRPICIYGASCFRKNKDHRRAYKHPRGLQNTQKPTGARTKRKRYDSPKKRNKKVYQDESTEDEYDMDDPFMADSGSEFEVDGVSDDTDSDVSEGTEEEFNRLLKEAKRFTRSKKKDSD